MAIRTGIQKEGSSNIRDGSITESHIAAGSIDEDHFKAGAVGAAALGVTAGTVSASKPVVVDANKAVDTLGITTQFRLAYNDTGSTISKGDLVTFVGAHTNGQPKIVLADANTADRRAEGAVQADILTGASGVVITHGLSPATLNTNSASSAGDPAFLSETPGGPTYTEEVETDEISQRVGYVVTKSATVGQLYYNFRVDEIAPTDVQGTAIIADTLTTKGDIYAATAASTVVRKAVGSDGQLLGANAGNTDGLEYVYADMGLTAGYRAFTLAKAANIDPSAASATISWGATATQFYVCGIYLPYDVTLTGVAWIQTVQGDTTDSNENRVGLYTSNGTTLTLVASSTQDTALWEGAAGTRQKAFTSTYAAQAGRYWIGVTASYSASATAPQVGGRTLSTVAAGGAFLPTSADEKMYAVDTGATSLPASQAFSGLTASTNIRFFAVY